MRKFLITIFVLIGLGIIGYFGYQALQTRRQANSISNLQTVSAAQGSLTATRIMFDAGLYSLFVEVP